MSVATLARSLLDRPAFRSRLDAATIESVAAQFPALKRNATGSNIEYDWPYLLRCGSVLAKAEAQECEDAALRIAQHCLTQGPDGGYRDAACVILDMLTNKPSIRLAEQRQLVLAHVERRLPLPLRAAWLKRELEFTVVSGDGEELFLNRFQKQLWDAGSSSQILSVTAPTSTGKSFLLCYWLTEYIRQTPNAFVAYIVPTRALIYQVENDLRHQFAEAQLNVNVSSLPMVSSLKDDGHNVMVLTQERLHILLLSLPKDRNPTLMIVDEAHKFGDGARGVLLHNVVDSVASRAPSMRLIFASPMVSNPEILLRGRDATIAQRSLASSHVTVNQNLLWVSQVYGHSQKWTVELCVGQAMVSLGEIDLPFRPNPDSKRLTLVAKTLSDTKGGNLIYANGAADAEKAAHQLAELSEGETSAETDTELASLIDLVKKYIHPDYMLVSTLDRGVAFHYGNMPLLIRTEIERLFKDNRIHYLVCTSTLIEGVNLPCKTIFVRGPQKGKGRPMNETDFWNLAGRAGRLGKEFQGNVVCIDPRRGDVWKTPPPTKRSTYPITPASDTIFGAIGEFLAYLRSDTPSHIAEKHPEYDQLLTYLLSQFSDSDGLVRATACAGLAADRRIDLEAAVRTVRNTLTIPIEIVNRNPGISPFAMQRLLQSFERHTGAVEDLIPVVPESQDAVEVYLKVFKRINEQVLPVFGSEKRAFALALLIVDWMRGHPLARIIASRIRYLTRKARKYDLAAVIRDVMQEVEQIARFTAPKYLSCYIDVLRHHLGKTNRDTIANSLPDVNLWLEFGASQRTQLSLMGLGLSRTTAIAISDFIVEDNLSEQEALDKLKRMRIDSLGLPLAIVRELKLLIGAPATAPLSSP